MVTARDHPSPPPMSGMVAYAARAPRPLTSQIKWKLSPFFVMLLVAAALNQSVNAQCGEPDAGNCCEGNMTPGCDDLNCCETVCSLVPSCCNLGWTSSCAIHASNYCHALCGECGSGSVSNNPCCTSNDTPYCYDESCCESVCDVMPACCEDEWDQSCADMAWELCPDLDGCSEPPICGSGAGSCCVANGTAGCSSPACCETICEDDPYCCEVEWDACCVNLAVEHCPGHPGCHLPGPNPPCEPGSGSCCEENGSPGCDNEPCCHEICGVDPFCCDVEWDVLCVDLAKENCPGFDEDDPFDPCIAHSLPAPAIFSCEGYCGGAAPSGCWCDEACCVFGDCCADKGDHCVGCQWGHGPPPLPYGGCGHPSTCGGQGDGGCWCDEGCFVAGDCCLNVCAGCPDLHGCEPNPADLTGNGRAEVDELLIILNNWGECEFKRCQIMEPCEGDFNHDSVINVDDLLFVLNNWGGT